MKKIIKLLTIGLAVLLTLCMSVSLVGCDWYNPPQRTVVEKYYGIVQREEIDGNEQLLVYIPEFGVCEIPSYPDEVTVKENDLICLEFAYLEFRENLEVTETYPAQFSKSARKCEVKKENLEFEIYEDHFIITIDLSEKFNNELLTYEKKVGDIVWFMSTRGRNIDENGNVEMIGEPRKITDMPIINISATRLSLRGNHISKNFLPSFFKMLGTGTFWLSTPEKLAEMGVE